MKKPLFIGTATWLMAATIFTNSTPLFAVGETKGSSEEEIMPNEKIIIDYSDKEGEESPKIPSNHKTKPTDVSPKKGSSPFKKSKSFILIDDSDNDAGRKAEKNRTQKLKSLISIDSSGNDGDSEKKPFQLNIKDFKEIKGNKTTLYPRRKITEKEQHINFKDSFKKKATGSEWFCTSIYNQACSLGRQVINSNLIRGNEAGGRFHLNIENLVCETNLFDEWLFLDGPKVKRIFQGGQDSEYVAYEPCRTIFFKFNADKDNVALVGSSYSISHTKGKSLDTIDKGKHIFQVLERLTASMPWVKKFLLPITIEIFTERGPQLSHQLLMELNAGKNPSIFIWDSLSELSTKDVKPIVEQVITEIKLAQIKFTSRIEDEVEILESENIISKHLNLHTAPMTYQQLSFQLPGTGNCTRFALFFALLRSESEDLQQYTVDTANRFCTFVKSLDPR